MFLFFYVKHVRKSVVDVQRERDGTEKRLTHLILSERQQRRKQQPQGPGHLPHLTE